MDRKLLVSLDLVLLQSLRKVFNTGFTDKGNVLSNLVFGPEWFLYRLGPLVEGGKSFVVIIVVIIEVGTDQGLLVIRLRVGGG